MLPWLGPAVAAAPLGWRTLAYTTLWVGHSLLVQSIVALILKVYDTYGLAKKNTRDPALPLWRMLWADVVGYYSWMVGAGLAHAWFNPTPDTWSFEFHFSKLLWYQLPILMVYDTWFFFVHRYAHINKWLFRHVHAMHHRFDAYLSVTSNSFEHPLDGLLVVGIPVGFVVALGCYVGNFWAVMVPMHTIACIFVFGHCGYDLTLDEWQHVALLALNPMLLIMMTAPNTSKPMDHEDHHTNPRVNFSLFFTYWDDFFECASPKRAPAAWLPYLVGLGFYVPMGMYYEWIYFGPTSFFIALVLHIFTPLPQLVYTVLGGPISRAVTRLPIWDALRRDLLVTYADPGSPGAFAADPARRYIFCYQPMGVQARGAYYTFAGKGAASPVSRLHTVKLAAGRVLWSTPVVQQLLALYDCCDSSYVTLRSLLTDKTPKSVCITIGGWRESKYLMSSAVVARCRRGFARLAAETGASIVPVIGVGEAYVAGEPTLFGRVFKSLKPYRPYPIKVVFGEPIVPAEGEDPDALRERYCAALLRLAKQHDVPLRIVE
ncbi:MAG: hypothetical protein J3K34DRAFT_418377 [Monoraphidium minutum]|nr:MAG: hypothetical protein J3K34DRAFT_418377 [Monoraphidium minutum]